MSPRLTADAAADSARVAIERAAAAIEREMARDPMGTWPAATEFAEMLMRAQREATRLRARTMAAAKAQHRITQRELAERLGISKVRVTQLVKIAERRGDEPFGLS